MLSQRGHGRVLDLGGAESHRSLWNRPHVSDVVLLEAPTRERLAELVDAGARFDTVFSAFAMVTAVDADALVAQIRDVLTTDGQLLFLEPSRGRGAPGRAHRLTAPGVTMATGWRVGRDVPATVRRAGLSVTDLERHRTTTVQWWLRTLVEGCAHRALEPARS